MNKLFSRSRKGQSAIEYLMTYGWMLLVVAIVGGAVMMTVQDSQEECQQQVTGLDSMDGFGIADFSTTSDSLNLDLENNQQDTVTVNAVTISGGDLTEDVEVDVEDLTLGFGDSEVVSTSEIGSDDDSCNTYTVDLDYETDDLPSEESGEIQDQMSEN